MRFREFEGHHPYVLRLEENEEVVGSIERFLAEQDIRLGHFIAFGSFSRVELQFFTVGALACPTWCIDEQLEVVSLFGNVTLMDGEPKVHAHCVVADEREETHGGHLKSGVVKPMLEVFLTSVDGEVDCVRDRAAVSPTHGIHVGHADWNLQPTTIEAQRGMQLDVAAHAGSARA